MRLLSTIVLYRLRRYQLAMREPPPNFNPPGWDADAPPPRYAMGKRVRVRLDAPFTPERRIRFLAGRAGVVERIGGHAPDGAAETGAAPFYRVRFALSELWPEGPGEGYGERDTLDLELSETCLEPFFNYSYDFAAETERVGALIEAGKLAPTSREDWREEGAPSLGVSAFAAGASMAARAWCDPVFKARLQIDGAAAAALMGLEVGAPQLVVFEQAGDERHLLVDSVVGLPLTPRALLREAGYAVPDDVRLLLHDVAGALRYMVLPASPSGAQGWTEEALAKLATLNALTGAGAAATPERAPG